ncbi:LysR family transcriptional regulator [Dactylosporangium vinaceum]|uniref:LysR substrate-binding domain-containing protein n=1 Tax=Dactylosporangium vinaceum TaxID=53362 RepID=A0ABV5M2W7_9ACTN|nr:LysR substrate-binding domain-containing protein [Dactylosporangium vinaceum]UAB99861.1 LysR family transcriptional regulator [Dactylosporangium vinaceum]
MADPLDLIHLRTLVAIADCGGFHRAASALRVSQSTVSQHVRLLERRLKEPLVEKAGRGVRLTVHGEALLVEARRILAVHDESLRRLEIVAERAIVVGCTEHAADRMLPQLLAALRAAFPGRSVRFRIDRSTQLAQAVGRGQVDLAVVLAGAEPLGTPVAELPLHWYAAERFVRPGGREPWPVVAFEEPCGLRSRALSALELAGLMTTITAESTSLDGVVAAVRGGLGIALLPSTGRTPAGLVALPELPAVGAVWLHLAARRGIHPELEGTAVEASREFFASPRLRSVA